MMENYDGASREELDKLNLRPPEAEKQYHFDWPDEFLQRILGSLLSDEYFLIQGINLIKPEYFRENAHRYLCRKILEHYDQYTVQPDHDILEAEIMEELDDGITRRYYLTELDQVDDAYEPGLEQREYFLDKITEFAKTQSLRLGYHKTLRLFSSKEKGKWDQIREILEEALRVERNIDIGLDYFETIEERYARVMQVQEDRDYFPTGFQPFDDALSGGLCRGEIGSYAGMSGSVKSLALVKSAKTNLLLGRNVAVISLELSEDAIAERFDSMITTVPIKSLYYGTMPTTVRQALTSEKEKAGQLIIKQFPAGQADVSTVRAYLAQLNGHGFYPDLVIVDYVGEFRDAPGIKTYESRQRIVRDLRGMAVELKICVLTAMQVNRAGRDAIREQDYLDDNVLADSAGQVRPLDALWTISQNEREQKAGVGTLFASKHRSGRGRFVIHFKRDDDTLEMKDIGVEAYQAELSKVESKTTEEVKLAQMSKDSWGSNKG